MWLRAAAVVSAVLTLVGVALPCHARSRRSSDGGTAQRDEKTSPKGKGHSRSGRGGGDSPGLDAALIERVNAAVASRDFAGALQKLGDAYRKNPDPDALYHMGRVLAVEGRLVEAQDLMRRYLADPGRAQDGGATVDDAQKVLRQPRPAAGEVALLADPGALLWVDDRPLGVLPLPQPLLLTGGMHNLTLEYRSRKLASPVQAVPGRLIEMRWNAASGAVVFTLRPAVIVIPSGAARALAEDVQRAIFEQVEQAAQVERLALMPLDVATGSTPQHKDCLDKPGCQRSLARDNKADFVLDYAVRTQDLPTGKSFQVDLTLRHAQVEEAASTAQKTCAPCTADQVAAALKESLSQLLADGVHRKRTTIDLTTDPAGAQVQTAAGQVLGKTPLSLQVWQGTHEVAISLSGYNVEKRRIDATESKRAPLSITLQRDTPEPDPQPLVQPPPPPPPTVAAAPKDERLPRPRWRVATGIALLGVGLTAAGFGLSGVVLEDQCVKPPLVEGGTCRVVYNSAPTGGPIMLVGLTVAVTGAILWAVPGPRRK